MFAVKSCRVVPFRLSAFGVIVSRRKATVLPDASLTSIWRYACGFSQMTPVSVPLRSRHLLPSNSTLKPWWADAEPANPRRPHTAITAPASLTLIAFFLPLKDSSGGNLPSTLSARNFGPGRGGLGELRGVDAHVRLHLAELDRRTAVRPGDHALERHLDTGHIAVIRVVDLRRDDADGRIHEANLPHEQP